MICENLRAQYANLNPRVCSSYFLFKFKVSFQSAIDPQVEEIINTCQSARRNAGETRVLYHYNGHGVPDPTASGDIWFFDEVIIYFEI